jgi:hypothetical protein
LFGERLELLGPARRRVDDLDGQHPLSLVRASVLAAVLCSRGGTQASPLHEAHKCRFHFDCET